MQPRPEVHAFLHAPTSTLSYVVWDPQSRDAAIIDPVLDYEAESGSTDTESADRIIAFVKSNGLKIQWILETHAHADHVTAAPHMRHELGGRTAIGQDIQLVQRHFRGVYNLPDEPAGAMPDFDHLFTDGESFSIGGVAARVLATPGHTPDHVAYLIGDALFVGDTIFMPDGGTARCDFPGGDSATLYRSIQRLFSLPDETRMFVLHDYQPGGRELRYETTVGDQKRDNIHVGAGQSQDDFVQMRDRRDCTLGLPRLIIPAVQVNIRGGRLPQPESNGTAYLKIPLNQRSGFSRIG